MSNLTIIFTILSSLLLIACCSELQTSAPAPKSPDLDQPQHKARFGLPETVRRLIHEEVYKAKLKAEALAWKKYPSRGRQILIPGSPLMKQREAIQKKRDGLKESIIEQAKNAIAVKYSLKAKQVEKIYREGDKKNWWVEPLDRGWRMNPEGQT